MKYIKILDFDTLLDLFKYILEGLRIDIYFLGNANNGSRKEGNDECYLSFSYIDDKYMFNYDCIFDKETKKFTSKKITHITELPGGSYNEN